MKHHLTHILMCLPMLVILAIGVGAGASAATLLLVIPCMLMMAMMMGGAHGDGHDDRGGPR